MNTKIVKRSGAKPSAAKAPSKGSRTQARSRAMSLGNIGILIGKLEDEMNAFVSEENVDTTLTGKDRLRLISSGVRNNGFIDKAFDIAHDNPDLMPAYLNSASLAGNGRRFEQLRQLMYVLEQFQQLAANAFMMQSDICYRQALAIYGALRAQTQAKVPGAAELFAALRTFFRRNQGAGTRTTEKELEHDFKNLIHGKADGELIIKNEAPRLVGGARKVVDNVTRRRKAVSVKASEMEEE